MNKAFLLIPLALLVLIGSVSSCGTVPVGHVGVKVNKLGEEKGVDREALSTGRYFLTLNESLYTFPTYMQNYVWTADETEGSPNSEGFSFQTIEGLSVSADIGISYQIDGAKVPTLFQTYRKGVDEIRNIYLRNIVRDALVKQASIKKIQSVYGAGKAELLDAVKDAVRAKVEPLGIMVHELSWVGDLRLPRSVVASINAKIEATQKAQQRENEVATARAEAEKLVVTAKGEAEKAVVKATAAAESRRIRAKAEAAANLIIARSLTEPLVRYEAIQKWNGALPHYNGGGAVPFVNVK